MPGYEKSMELIQICGWEKKIGFDDFLDVTKCLQHIENPDLVHMCAWLNEQPSNIKTMEISDIFHLGDEGKIHWLLIIYQ